jgi:hypothetical protein
MKRTILAIFALVMIWTCCVVAQEKRPFTADRHKALKIACVGCHGEEDPKKPATAEACSKCHQSLEAVAERTKNLKPNPHHNHLTEGSEVACTQCHASHKADDIICERCHSGLKFEKQEAAK